MDVRTWGRFKKLSRVKCRFYSTQRQNCKKHQTSTNLNPPRKTHQKQTRGMKFDNVGGCRKKPRAVWPTWKDCFPYIETSKYIGFPCGRACGFSDFLRGFCWLLNVTNRREAKFGYLYELGGGFKYFLFSHLLRKISTLTSIFPMDWNHQLVNQTPNSRKRNKEIPWASRLPKGGLLWLPGCWKGPPKGKHCLDVTWVGPKKFKTNQKASWTFIDTVVKVDGMPKGGDL